MKPQAGTIVKKKIRFKLCLLQKLYHRVLFSKVKKRTSDSSEMKDKGL
jgi:hypothetical protein